MVLGGFDSYKIAYSRKLRLVTLSAVYLEISPYRPEAPVTFGAQAECESGLNEVLMARK